MNIHRDSSQIKCNMQKYSAKDLEQMRVDLEIAKQKGRTYVADNLFRILNNAAGQ